MGVDLVQYRSAIGSIGLLFGTPGTGESKKSRKKMEEQEVKASRARAMFKKDAIIFWQTVFMITIPVMVILSLCLSMMLTSCSINMTKATSSTYIITKQFKPVSMNTVEFTTSVLGVASVIRMLLLIAGVETPRARVQNVPGGSH